MRNKIFGALVLAGLALVALGAGTSLVQQGGVGAVNGTYLFYSTGSTNAAGTLSYAVIGCNAANGGAPVVTHLDAISDKAASKVQFYRVDALTTATGASSTTRLDVTGTNAIADNGTIVIRHVSTDQYEKRTLTTSTGATNLVVTAAPFTALAAGDIVYHVTTAGAGFINLKTNSFAVNGAGWEAQLDGPGIYTGQPGCPLLMEVDGTSAATLSSVSAEFRAVPR